MTEPVLHVTPAYYGEEGIFGGGERYSAELARAMARSVATKLVGFADRHRRFQEEDLEIELLPSRYAYKGSRLNPLHERLLSLLVGARAVHVHQIETVLADICIPVARIRRIPVFLTDHGGSAPNLARYSRRDSLVTGLLAVSRFSAEFYPHMACKTTVILGGVDQERYRPEEGIRRTGVLFVGRMLPHKGIDRLIAALPQGVPLRVLGHAYDPPYRAALARAAEGHDITFEENATDNDVVEAYRQARVVVLPSVTHIDGTFHAPKSELLGLVLLEAMACGTPVICSDVGGMPEVVRDGVTGHIVPAGDVTALRRALVDLLFNDERWLAMSRAAATHVHGSLTWDHVAGRCLEAYRLATQPRSR